MVCALTLSCGVVKKGVVPWENRKEPAIGRMAPPSMMATGTMSENLTRDEKKWREALDLAHKDWKGTPYVWGGKGYNGVDCSSFMQIVFEDYFGIILPRVTSDQIKVGSGIKKQDIKIGDMVFFRTGRNTLHVGVMINTSQFLHASTSSGVMISALQERYWNDAYLTTRRIL